MGRILDVNGVDAAKEVHPINYRKAELTHKVVMIYLDHNFGQKCTLCDCAGCTDVRDALVPG